MATMIVELYDALKAAGAPEDKAQAAAMALANRNGRFDRVDERFNRVDAEILWLKTELGQVKTDVALLKTDVATLKTDVGTLKVDVGAIRAELGMVKWIVSGVGFGVVLLVLRSFWSGA